MPARPGPARSRVISRAAVRGPSHRSPCAAAPELPTATAGRIPPAFGEEVDTVEDNINDDIVEVEEVSAGLP
ncbi:hypothetical protein GCM10009665_37350 [Kitasatospora nipponensis]|uniref:Uncharacterized protein n=1 Tax=Kitasatospora nipponensis TaxID=258049 RepID=A0ABP4GXX7_9ACTN